MLKSRHGSVVPSSPPNPSQLNHVAIEWCCDQEYESCTQGEGQINVCISKFANANKDVSIADANAIESSRAPDKNTASTSLSYLLGTSSTPAAIAGNGVRIPRTARTCMLIQALQQLPPHPYLCQVRRQPPSNRSRLQASQLALLLALSLRASSLFSPSSHS